MKRTAQCYPPPTSVAGCLRLYAGALTGCDIDAQNTAGPAAQSVAVAHAGSVGTVIMCQACSKAAGLTQSDDIDGVTMGSFDVIEGWLYAPDVQTLAW